MQIAIEIQRQLFRIKQVLPKRKIKIFNRNKIQLLMISIDYAMKNLSSPRKLTGNKEDQIKGYLRGKILVMIKLTRIKEMTEFHPLGGHILRKR